MASPSPPKPWERGASAGKCSRKSYDCVFIRQGVDNILARHSDSRCHAFHSYSRSTSFINIILINVYNDRNGVIQPSTAT